MSIKSVFNTVKEAVVQFDNDGATALGAALAFYTSLSLAPLLIILMFVAGIIGHDAQRQLIAQLVGLMGPQVAVIIQMILESATEQQDIGLLSAILGTGAVVLSATAVFGQLQSSMNRIWNVEAKPRHGAILSWLRKRLLSLGMMAGVGFLLLVSLSFSTALQLIFTGEGLGWQLTDLCVSLLFYTLLFGMIFKVLPDVSLGWRDVWQGALITAILFGVGKFAIGKYLGYSSIGSAYGAAGSLIVLLVWVYYSSLIVFLGAELAKAISRSRGQTPPPEEFAVEGNPQKGEENPVIPSTDT